jgi:hypothetical protein
MWLHRDAIIEKIETAIDALADDAHALTAEQRCDQLAEIDRERLTVERAEEHCFTEAVAAGANIIRRPTADARAVLGLSSAMPAPPT